jgi:carbohydrate kinase (thermoresistant glucokinase family)
MGVAGCGKSSVGEALAERCGIEFVDGDTLHPKSNIEKMSSGTPLDDGDRAPWLSRVGRTLAEAKGPIVIGCSALKVKYRDLIRREVSEPVMFLHLDAPQPVLARRMASRTGHFMPPALLDSQFAALEPLGPQEAGAVIDIDAPLEQVVSEAEAHVRAALG